MARNAKAAVRVPLLNRADAGFERKLERLLDRAEAIPPKIPRDVAKILAEVRRRGDAAVLKYTRKWDKHPAKRFADLAVAPARLKSAAAAISADVRAALETAAERVRVYHEKQKTESWRHEDADGTVLGQQVTALDRVGIYVPGGLAAYPSSVLMNAIPARVAGVGEIVMTVPAPKGELNPTVLAAAALAGVDRIYTVGGAQAIGALAYGTATISRVDKIVGPGNAYVTEAKRQVYGQVDIDMISGPSEVLVLCDGRTDPEWVAM